MTRIIYADSCPVFRNFLLNIYKKKNLFFVIYYILGWFWSGKWKQLCVSCNQNSLMVFRPIQVHLIYTPPQQNAFFYYSLFIFHAVRLVLTLITRGSTFLFDSNIVKCNYLLSLTFNSKSQATGLCKKCSQSVLWTSTDRSTKCISSNNFVWTVKSHVLEVIVVAPKCHRHPVTNGRVLDCFDILGCSPAVDPAFF